MLFAEKSPGAIAASFFSKRLSRRKQLKVSFDFSAKSFKFYPSQVFNEILAAILYQYESFDANFT
jgi:hypothetical protein